MKGPRTPTGRRLLTTNKDDYSAIAQASLPRNLTVRESEILDIEAELLGALEDEGYHLFTEDSLAAAMAKCQRLDHGWLVHEHTDHERAAAIIQAAKEAERE